MWWCFPVTSSYVGGMEDINRVLTWISAIKPVTWPGWPSIMKTFLVMCSVWQSEWCSVIWVPWYMQFVKWPFPPYVSAVSGILCNMCWNLFGTYGCVVEGLSVVIVLVLLFIPPLYWFLFSFDVDLFSFQFASCCWWLVWLNIFFI